MIWFCGGDCSYYNDKSFPFDCSITYFSPHSRPYSLTYALNCSLTYSGPYSGPYQVVDTGSKRRPHVEYCIASIFVQARKSFVGIEVLQPYRHQHGGPRTAPGRDIRPGAPRQPRWHATTRRLRSAVTIPNSGPDHRGLREALAGGTKRRRATLGGKQENNYAAPWA